MIIITVNFNRPEFLSVQLPLIQRNLQPEAIHVINTGLRNNGCKDIAKHYDAKYMYIDTGGDYSQSHALALNVGYAANRQLTDIIGILDHDCFPVKAHDVKANMIGKWFYSCNQERLNRLYPNPACMFMATSIGEVDFMPCAGMDTAGQLYKVYTQVRPMEYKGFDEYEMFAGSFIHIIKGSNWVKTTENALRVDRVFNKVKSYL